MIVCNINLDGTDVANVDIRPLGEAKGELQDYVVQVVIDKGEAVGKYTRIVYDWPKDATNPLALLKAALALVDTEMTAVEGEVSGRSPDMERGLDRSLQTLPGETSSSVRNHRSPVRRGQSVQHGEDFVW